jgi:sodium-dependent dicarboxylate transporter 2/3/5
VSDPRQAQARLARFGRWAGPLAFLALLAAPALGLDLGLSDAQRLTAAALAWTALWWLTEAVPIGAASLLPAVLLPATGVLGAREVAAAYMNDLILLFLGAFFLAFLLERWGLHRRLALEVAGRVGARPRRLVLGFILAATLLSMWLNNTACALMLMPIADAVVAAVDPPESGRRHTPFAAALLLGMAYACNVGGMLTPVGTAPNQVLLGQLQARFPERPEIGFHEWMLATLPIGLLFVPLCWWLLTRFALRVDGDSLAGAQVLEQQRRALGRLRPGERRAAWVFAAAVFGWVFRSDLELGLFTLPGWERLLPEPRPEISNSTVALALALLCFVLPSGEARGGALLDWETARKVPLDVLLLLGGGFALAEGIQTAGLDSLMAQALTPLLEDLPRWLALALLVMLISALTEVTSNVATTQVLLPVLAGVAAATGDDPVLWMLPATLAASCAFMLPVGTPPNAIVITTGRLQVVTMARVGLWMNLLMLLVIAGVTELWIVPLLGLGGD